MSDPYNERFFDLRNDVAFKKVFVGHPDLTISFLNSTLRLTGDRRLVSVDFLSGERLPMTAESKKSILDVLCVDQQGHQYIIEVQNKHMLHYLQRIQYYMSHVYAGQLPVASQYENLKPVTMLNVLNHKIFPKEVPYLSFHETRETETQVVYMEDMSYAFIELPKFNKTADELVTEEDHWIFALKEATHLQEAPKTAPEEVKKAFDILERYKWTREESLNYQRANIALMDDIDTIDTARIEGLAEGHIKGKEEGLAEGLAEGHIKGKKEGLAEGKEAGLAEGLIKGKLEAAQKLLEKGMDKEEVAHILALDPSLL